ncbi:MAG TPA: glycine cleavage system protein GcvH [Candidatus Eisenbacteria bacterium]|nr:glycine cleavage system protein GcvH [Candidatus Eisenbacteria bacterium]
MSFPEDLRYTAEHEWARLEDGVVTVGITSYATDQLGDVVFVELPEVGRKLEAMKPFGVVEAVKTVSDLFAPVAGEVVAVNDALSDNPALVNQEPFGGGWMIRIRPADAGAFAKLMSSDDYSRHVEEQHA